MAEDVPHGLDRKSLKMVFYGKMAITEALDDNFEAALDYAEHAKFIFYTSRLLQAFVGLVQTDAFRGVWRRSLSEWPVVTKIDYNGRAEK